MHYILRFLMMAATLGLLGLPTATAQPTLEAVVLTGGPGDQHAAGVDVAASVVYATGWDDTASGGMFLACSMPLSVPDWSSSVGYLRGPVGVEMVNSVAYLGGWAWPPYCGASDGVGGTEGKPALYLYDDAGTLLGCNSTNFFPYRGGELYEAALAAADGSAVYLAGRGEEMGWGGFRTILAGYAADGTLLWKRRYATDLAGNHLGGTYTRIGSGAQDLAWLDGVLYVAGWDRDASNVGGSWAQGMLLRVDAGGQTVDPPGVYASNLYPVWERLAGMGSRFRAVTALNGHVYVAGSTFRPGDCDADDLLVEKYDPMGNLVWRSNPTEVGSALFFDLVAVGDRLFGVGRLDALCSGDFDVMVTEINPADGTLSSPLLWGGSWPEQPVAAVAKGGDLFLVGDTQSFTEGGNGVGQSDIFLLHLSVAPPDADGDGVPDSGDLCPGTEPGARVDAYGCSIAQYCPCDYDASGEPWKNHGAYVSCLAHAAESFVSLGLITEAEKEAVVSLAAESRCGAKVK